MNNSLLASAISIEKKRKKKFATKCKSMYLVHSTQLGLQFCNNKFDMSYLVL